MDDPLRQPRNQDRERVTARIQRAYVGGRIGAADRDIRLRNVQSAQSMTELDLMDRELAQLEVAIPGGPAAPVPPAGVPAGEQPGWQPGPPVAKPGRPGRPGRTIGIVVLVVFALVILGIGTAIFAGIKMIQGAVETGTSASDDAGPDAADRRTGPAYELTEEGIRAFLETYRERWGTSVVIDLVLYDDYAIVTVPASGSRRPQEWLYRDASGFTDFGGGRATIPGAVPIDTDDLDVSALVRNIERARKTLNVPDPEQTYVVIRHLKTFDEVPSVDIHLYKEFGQTGYVATTLDGTVKRAYPYRP